MVVRVLATVRDGVDWVVTSEEQCSSVVCEGDALTCHLEVHNVGLGQGPTGEQLGHCSAYGLRSRQRLRLHGDQIEHVASYRLYIYLEI
jgi:hypothetical protein